MNRKIFGVGMFRTGTTTLGACFKKLGYNRHYGFWQLTNYYSDTVEEDLLKHLPEIYDKARENDVFEDAPWFFCYKQLDAKFPGSKFILTLRESAEKLAQSETKWHIINGVKKKDIPNLDFFIQRYKKHNAQVREYFSDRPDDLLEICWEKGDGWSKLCNFLGKDIPKDSKGNELPVPRLNASHPLRKYKYMVKRLLVRMQTRHR